MTTKTDLELAKDLGLPDPRFDVAANPGLARSWGDRVRLVDSLRRGGRDDAEAVRSVLTYGGNPIPKVAGPVPMPTRTRPAPTDEGPGALPTDPGMDADEEQPSPRM